MRKPFRMWVVVAGALLSASAVAQDALTAGAAKVEITPPPQALRPGQTVRDPLHARALVLQSGKQCAVLVGLDQAGVPTPLADRLRNELAERTRCARESILISATHTHSGGTAPGGLGGAPEPEQVAQGVIEAVVAAQRQMRPARLAFGTTSVDLNMNRDLFHKTRWVQGPNPHGVADKTLAVVEVLDSDDLPIAVVLNYAMHPINFFLSDVVSADFPGEASRYIERHFPNAVALFTQGASGDLNPRFRVTPERLSTLRLGMARADDLRPTKPPLFEEKSKGFGEMIAAIAAPLPAEQEGRYREEVEQTGELVRSMGVILGEAAIDAMANRMSPLTQAGPLWSGQTRIQCPGRDRLDRNDPVREGTAPPYGDGDPVQFHVGLLRLGNVHLLWLDAEVYNRIALRMKEASPANHLALLTLTNGVANSGYIYSNEAGAHLTFQVIGSRLKPGCAEDGIIEAGLALMAEAAQ